jgi:hypothetical protein
VAADLDFGRALDVAVFEEREEGAVWVGGMFNQFYKSAGVELRDALARLKGGVSHIFL